MEDAVGAWNILGYGNVMDLDAEGARAFTVTASLGWEVTEILELEASEMLLGPHLADGRRLFATSVGETPYLIERMEALPPRCTAETEWTKARLFQAFEETMTERYAFFDVRGFDWKARADAARARVTEDMSEEDLALLMAD